MKSFVFDLGNLDSVQLFDAVAHRPYALFLDSADRDHPNASHSFIFFDPVKTVESGFNELEKNLEHLTAAGYFGYDLGRTLETLPQQAQKNPNIPVMAVGLYDFVIAFDHAANTTTLTIQADTEAKALERKEVVLHSASSEGRINSPADLRVAKTTEASTSTKTTNDNNHPSPPRSNYVKLNWRPDISARQYKSDIQTIINYIHAGDIFQANLSQHFCAALPQHFCAWNHYKYLRKINPAPFAAYMNLGKVKIASCSPERFLTLKNGEVQTHPIKGTLPRSKDPKILENSKKDRAENIMIVDLLRNDLSKVCEAGSIHVPELCKLETFTKVHHLVSTITGKLKENETPLGFLKACFPGGSITGAPKIRAMEIIEELETHRRGPYCGAIGYITPDDTMDTNILIRTLVYDGNQVTLNVGGGITAGSNVEAEYQETLDKASGILESFGI